MRRPLRLVNLILGLVAVLIAAAVVKSWVSPVAPIPSSATAVTSQDLEVLPYNPTTRPPVNQFEGLLDKNPFKQPPPMPVTSSRGAPPEPLPALVGTILVDSDRRAILSNKGKADIYTVGQTVTGGVITEIKEDRILLKRGDETVQIMLKAAIKSTPPAGGEAPSPAPAGAAPPPPHATSEDAEVAVQPPSMPSLDQTERERRRQERRRLMEERRLRRGESNDR